MPVYQLVLLVLQLVLLVLQHLARQESAVQELTPLGRVTAQLDLPQEKIQRPRPPKLKPLGRQS
jgi:hypothetical protein